MHRPIGDEQGARAGVKEGAAEAGRCLSSSARSSARITCGQHNPVGIKLELKDFLHRQQTVTRSTRDGWRGQCQRRLCQPIEITWHKVRKR